MRNQNHSRDFYDINILRSLRSGFRKISDFQNPTHDMQMAAVEYRANEIKYIKNPTYEVRKFALELNAGCIQFIKNPSHEEVHLALSAHVRHIIYIEKLNPKHIDIFNKFRNDIIIELIEILQNHLLTGRNAKNIKNILNRIYNVTNWPEIVAIRDQIK